MLITNGTIYSVGQPIASMGRPDSLLKAQHPTCANMTVTQEDTKSWIGSLSFRK